MRLIKALCIALATYTVVPVPQFEWKEQEMRSAICFLPAAGLFCGAALYLWSLLCGLLCLPAALFAAVATALPLAVTGGIHMDGFMDTSDALASHQSRERMLAIMKDPHCGAFAVIRCCVYLLCSFGLYYAEYNSAYLIAVCIGFVLSRCLVVLSALTLPNARGGGMLAAYTEHADRSAAISVMCCVGICCVAAMLWLCGIPGVTGALAALLTFLWYRSMAKRHFGGTTGDTSGYFLQLCELSLLLGIFMGGLLI